MSIERPGEQREFRFLIPIAGMFVATLLLANTTGVKLLQIGPLVLPAGIILFPISYIFGDVLTEVYGYARTRRVIWTGFGANLLMVLTYWVVIALPAAPFWAAAAPTDSDPIDKQQAIGAILGQVPRLVIASIAGYWIGEFVNSFVLAKMKVFTKGRHLWMRTIGSTVAGQSVDTVAFVLIAFAGTVPVAGLVRTAVSLYVVKVAYEVIATPATYAIVGFLKRNERVDHFDIGTEFTPFRW